MTKEVTEKEQALIDKELGFLDSVYGKQSCGYAEAEVFDYDDDFIDVELKYGIQGGQEHSETLKIDRAKCEWAG